MRAQLLSTTTRFEPSNLLKSCLIDIWKFSLCALIFKYVGVVKDLQPNNIGIDGIILMDMYI